MKKYYYDINNSNKNTDGKKKNESFITKFYNSVRNVGKKLHDIISLNVETNDENKNINEQRIYDNIEQINFNDVPSSLYESFTEHNSIRNKEINTYPKKMTRVEYKQNPYIKNTFSQKEVKNFKGDEMVNNKIIFNSNSPREINYNLNNKDFTHINYDNIYNTNLNSEINKKNQVNNSFYTELKKKRKPNNNFYNLENEFISPNKSNIKENIISNVNTFQIEGNKSNINESNISMSTSKNFNNTSLMSVTLRSLDDIKNDIDKKRLESIKEVEKFRGKYSVSYDLQKDYQTRKKIIEDYYKKKIAKFEEITQKFEREKRDRLDSFKYLKELKEQSFNIKPEKKPKIVLSTMKSGEISFSGTIKPNNNNSGFLKTFDKNVKQNNNTDNNTNNNNNNKNDDSNKLNLFSSFGVTNNNNTFFNNEKKDDNKISLLNNEKKDDNTNLFTDNKNEKKSLLFENKNENESNNKTIFTSNIQTNNKGSLFSPNQNINNIGSLFSNINKDNKTNSIFQSIENKDTKSLFDNMNNSNITFEAPSNKSNTNSEKENQKSIFKQNQNENTTSIFSGNPLFGINNQTNQNENKSMLFPQQNFQSPEIKKEQSNSLFGAQTITFNQTKSIINPSINSANKTSIFQSNNKDTPENKTLINNNIETGSLYNQSNPFLNTSKAAIANVFTSPVKSTNNNNSGSEKILFDNQINNNTNMFGNINNGERFSMGKK